MNQTVAFEVGAVFLLAVLLMAGTKMKGACPQLGRNVQYVLIAAAVIVACVAAYRMLPEAYGGLLSIFPDSGPSAPSLATPGANSHAIPTPQPARPATPKRASVTAGASKGPGKVSANVSDVEYIITAPSKPPSSEPQDEALQANPGVPPVDGAAPMKENRAKRALKSIGRALHIGKSDKSPE